MRVFQDSMALYSSSAEMLSRWTGSTSVIFAADGRRGNRTARTAGTSWVIMPAARSEWWVGFAWRARTIQNTTFAIWKDTANRTQIDLRLTVNGELIITRNGTELARSSVGVFKAEVWTHIQWYVKIDSVAGASAVRLNGATTPVVEVSGVNTQATVEPGAIRFEITGWWSEIVVNDNQGTANNSWPGDVRIDVIQPTADGSLAGWTPSTGARYECVRDVPVSTTKYIESDVPGDIALFQLPTLPPGSIQALQTVMYGMKTDAGERTVAPVIRIGGSNYEGTAVQLADSWAFTSEIWETNPATGTAWQPGQQIEAGVKVAS